jgi:hypothetical protein
MVSNSVHRKVSQSPRDHNYIAWERVETNLIDSKCDVLVILDCCEAGSLGGYPGRGPNRSFELLAACGKGETTEEPGKGSFTSALIFALQRLKEDKHTFTSQDLLDEIKNAPDFPISKQTPQLFSRHLPSDDNVWIAPRKGLGKTQSSSNKLGEYRQADHEHMDLRLYFNYKISDADIKDMATYLSGLIKKKQPKFKARHVKLLDVTSIAAKYTTYWRRTASNKRKSPADNMGDKKFSPLDREHDCTAKDCERLQHPPLRKRRRSSMPETDVRR